MFWLNSLPANDSVSKELSARTIMTGQKLGYNQHCQFEFGEYVQMHEQHNTSMVP